jgi:hypothetical protein
VPSLAASATLFLAALLAAGPAAGQAGPDYEREKRWAAQVVPNLVVGEAVWLQAAGMRFLALHAPAPAAKGAVILVHGPGVHPDHGLTGELRMALVDRGYETLSLQMPLLGAADEGGPAYQALFPEAALRIAAGVQYLQARGYARVAIVSHALGSGMTYQYLRTTSGAPLVAWAAISFYGVFEDIAGARFPVLDLYGASDYRGIRGSARERARILATVPGSRQIAVAEGGRFLAGGEQAALREIADFLGGVFVNPK